MSEQKTSQPEKVIRVFIVDDHPWVRTGLASLIGFNKQLVLCGETEDAESALQAIPEAKPDVVLVDISLKGPVDGVALTKQIRLRFPSLIVLVLSMHIEADWAERALAAGAHGYMIKSDAADQLLDALPHLVNGEIFVSEEIRHKLDPALLQSLTDRAHRAH